MGLVWDRGALPLVAAPGPGSQGRGEERRFSHFPPAECSEPRPKGSGVGERGARLVLALTTHLSAADVTSW